MTLTLTCNNCAETKNMNETINWVTVSFVSEESTDNKFHFCNWACLASFATAVEGQGGFLVYEPC